MQYGVDYNRLCPSVVHKIVLSILLLYVVWIISCGTTVRVTLICSGRIYNKGRPQIFGHFKPLPLMSAEPYMNTLVEVRNAFKELYALKNIELI